MLGIDAPTTYGFTLSRGTQGMTMYFTHHIIKSKWVRRLKWSYKGWGMAYLNWGPRWVNPKHKVFFLYVSWLHSARTTLLHVQHPCDYAARQPLLGLGFLSIMPFSSSTLDIVATARIDGIRKWCQRWQLRWCHHLSYICYHRHEPHQSTLWHMIIQWQWWQALFCFLAFVSGFAVWHGPSIIIWN